MALAVPAQAQLGAATASPPEGRETRKQARAVRLQPNALRFNGRLDDAVWREAPPITDFLQKEPTEGAPPGDSTAVAFAFDDHALYVGARMWSRAPGEIQRLVGRRDDPGNTERIILTFDTYCDRRTSYSFALSTAGVRSDYYHPTDNEFDREHTWNPVWEGRAVVDSLGWTAEMRIPFSQLRFNDQPEQVWGVNVNRWVPQRNEDIFWIYVPKNGTGWASRFGDLTGIAGIRPPRRLELLPYVAGSGAFDGNVPDADPFRDGSDFEGRAGGDLKMGLGPNLTLDGTVNPDFGQVEADPAEINLTQFETFFEERRPFFIEGSQLLQGNGPSYYYSRRIGAVPPGSAPGDYVDRPATTTILGAAKVTGRLASGTSLGVLGAFTDREFASTYDAETDVTDRVEVAPRAGWGVLRLQQEFGASGSTAGLSMTAVSRDLEGGEPLADRLTRHAYTGGGDWNLRFQGGDYVLSGWGGFSWVEGTANAIRRVQTAPAHNYQRPDAGHVELDPTRTSLGGWTAGLQTERRGGSRWLWGGGVELESPGFEINDLGSLQSADDIASWLRGRYRETQPGRIFHSYDLRLTTLNNFNFGGVRTASGLYLDTNWTWRNFMSTYVGVGHDFTAYNDDQTRGGPLFETAPGSNVAVAVSSNFARTTRWEAAAGYWHNALDSYSAYAEFEYAMRPGSRWEFSIIPEYVLSSTARQYVTTRPGGPDATFGTRYIFARIDRSTLRLQARLNYSFTPDLALEVYAEPFASSGVYDEFGELRAARTNELLYYGTEGTTIERDENDNLTITDGPDTLRIERGEYPGDFMALSYRSNVVLRWEWRRGSTLYFIWQKNRGDFQPDDRTVRPGDLWDALTAPGQDVLAVKATYWFPVD